MRHIIKNPAILMAAALLLVVWRLAWQQLEEVKWAAVPDAVPQRAGKP
jgi:hypothetical protein